MTHPPSIFSDLLSIPSRIFLFDVLLPSIQSEASCTTCYIFFHIHLSQVPLH